MPYALCLAPFPMYTNIYERQQQEHLLRADASTRSQGPQALISKVVHVPFTVLSRHNLVEGPLQFWSPPLQLACRFLLSEKHRICGNTFR